MSDLVIVEGWLDPVLKTTDIALAIHVYLLSSPWLSERKDET
jgi:hypothetical protein